MSWSKMQQDVCASLARNKLVAHVLLAFQKQLLQNAKGAQSPSFKHLGLESRRKVCSFVAKFQ